MQKRKLEELNLLDDFLFGSMVTFPGIGGPFVRELLRIIFGREFDQLIVVPQKTYYGEDTDMHGARLDVYLEEVPIGESNLERATVYDMEPDQNDGKKDRENLPKRTRFYHAKIDAGSLQSGESYENLKNVIVIMITSYDPFGKDHMVYTIQNQCKEIPDMDYDDGARTLYLYVKGKKGNPSEELRQLLHYMEHTTDENAKNETLLGIQKMVQTVKRNKEVSKKYMKIFEREERLIKQGQEMEKENTERERKRAEEAEAKAEEAEAKAEEAEAKAGEAEVKAAEAQARAEQAEAQNQLKQQEIDRLRAELDQLKKR